MTTPRIQTYNSAETCKLLSVSRATLDRMVRDGQLRRVKLRGRSLYRATELERLLERSTR